MLEGGDVIEDNNMKYDVAYEVTCNDKVGQMLVEVISTESYLA